MKLYSYWRSTTAYRVRIALALKRVEAEIVPVDLLAGDQRTDPYVALNPIKGVPTLVLDDGAVLTQSLAIMSYLDAVYPGPALVPADPVAAAQVQAAAMAVAIDIHPVNNLKVLNKLKDMGHSQDDCIAWMHHWMAEGLADTCLVAQLYNAHRWGVALARDPRLAAIEDRCIALPAFATAHPDNQPDAP